ncbi:cytochrome AA3 biosynthesis protein [Candidatus Bathyarchaeota archaeon]|nr:MAG: cytochrome AA3 biosynthesis protein [Candidatus Bathyarchaeota archaeon]
MRRFGCGAMASPRGTVGLRILAYGSALSTYVLIVIGGYVVFSGSGVACGSSGPDSWPLCNGQALPTLSGPVLVEWTHRLFTLVVGLFVLGTTVIAWSRHRQEKRILQLSTISSLVLLGQILLGMATVKTGLDPLVSTAHLAVASALLAVVMLNAITVRRFTTSSDLVLR